MSVSTVLPSTSWKNEEMVLSVVPNEELAEEPPPTLVDTIVEFRDAVSALLPGLDPETCNPELEGEFPPLLPRRPLPARRPVAVGPAMRGVVTRFWCPPVGEEGGRSGFANAEGSGTLV